ncbi:MAG: restriction endonuclease [Candidatus ainarchaeum sp.]|nr:restriction endonuclease [Candidatus ainarchaeum sp.]
MSSQYNDGIACCGIGLIICTIALFFFAYPLQVTTCLIIIALLWYLSNDSRKKANKVKISNFNKLDKNIKEILINFAIRHNKFFYNLADESEFDIYLTTSEFNKKVSQLNSEELTLLLSVLEKKGLKENINEIGFCLVPAFFEQLSSELKKEYSKSNDAEAIAEQFYKKYDEQSVINYELFEYILKIKNIAINNLSSDYLLKFKNNIKDYEINLYETKLKTHQNKIEIEDFDELNGYDFERILKELFIKMNYTVEQTKLSNDQGADLIAIKFGEKFVIQAKRYQGKVSNKAIQEVVASKKFYGADEGIVITTNYFTKSAIQLADANKIELIDRRKLKKLIDKYL